MKPRGMMMIEHRLIEKVLKVVDSKARSLPGPVYDPLFTDIVVDFIRTYADRTHHGKEEDILFQELAGKKLDPDDARIMSELVEEHRQARQKVKELVGLNESYKKGGVAAVASIRGAFLWLTDFYPRHIEKEDKVFFPGTEKYFTQAELDRMLERFHEFDRSMIHEKYKKVYESISSW